MKTMQEIIVEMDKAFQPINQRLTDLGLQAFPVPTTTDAVMLDLDTPDQSPVGLWFKDVVSKTDVDIAGHVPGGGVLQLDTIRKQLDAIQLAVATHHAFIKKVFEEVLTSPHTLH